MKKIILSLTALLCVAGLQAQTSYEAINLVGSDLNGTARFVGMGGAMSALGADVSTISSNPAGIGLYRSCDMMTSFGAAGNTVSTKFGNISNRNLSTNGSYDNIGLVIANKHSNEGTLRFWNFGFNYHKAKDFNQKMSMGGDLGGLSISGQMASQVFDNQNIGDAFFDQSDVNYGFTNHNYYGDGRFGWLSLMGADSRMIDASAFNDGYYYPSESCTFTGEQSGHIGQFDFNFSFNFVDQVYLGATLGITNVDYRFYSEYTEQFADGDLYFQNWYKTQGSGVNFGVGAIIRPFEDSSFRIGVAATTKTMWDLTDLSSAYISTVLYGAGVDDQGQTCDIEYKMDTQSSDAFDGDCSTSYTNVTPGKLNVSLGYTLESGWALGAEWEYMDYGQTRLFEQDGRDNAYINDHTARQFTGHNTFRLGVEKNLLSNCYLRAGYNHMMGGYGPGAWKSIPVNSVQTNVDYTNYTSADNYTAGLGIRGEVFYADFALLYGQRHGNFYPFDNTELKATSLTHNTVKGILTLGMRF